VKTNLLAGIAASCAIHILWLAGAARASTACVEPSAVTEIELAVDLAPPPAPEPEAEPEKEPPGEAAEEPEAPASAPPPAAQQPAAPAARAAAAQPAAQAGQTLTAPETGSSADDTADFTLVQGSGANYAGGTTAAQGTAASAVHGPASPAAAAGARSAPAAPAATRPASSPDLSRGAAPVAADWNCSSLFPSDPGAGDQAMVTIVVTVRSDGTPQSVAILSDPGHGFGSAARSCALGQRYAAALDRDGHATTASTPPIRVRFAR
jgi:protein TonB